MTKFAARFAKSLAAGAALLLVSAPAIASTYDLSLSGTVAAGNYSSFAQYRFYGLALSGATTPFALEVGDVLNITVSLDEMLFVPSGTDRTYFGVSLRTDPESLGSPPDNGVSSSYSVTFLDGDLSGETYYGACTNCLAGSMSIGPDVSFSVSSFTTSILIENLVALDPLYSGGFSVSTFEVGYQATDLAPPVPEPGEWAMLGLGLAVTGAFARRRTRATA